MTDFHKGLLLGILIGEGHFGGDGKQPQCTLRMHSRHRELFQFLLDCVPGSRLYGPYEHGGRSYYQWMARGQVLREVLVPILESEAWERIEPVAHQKYTVMKERYRIDPDLNRPSKTERPQELS